MGYRAWALAGTAFFVAVSPSFGAYGQAVPTSNPVNPTPATLGGVPVLNAASQAALQKATTGSQRIEPTRDRWRNPAATLQFFGVRPTDTVVEVWPGQGWYTSILGPYLKQGGGSLVVGHFDAASTNSSVVRQIVDAYRARFAADQGTYGNVSVVPFGPRSGPLGMAGSADSVLTFRNIHNWMAQGWAEKAFADFFLVLKPGGILGIEEHRGRTDEPQDPLARDGYVREDFVIQLAREAGFEFVGRSEINANPADTKDHPFGVWTLAPVSRTSPLGQRDDPGFDRTRFDAIGESDRMTLRFRKPLSATGGPPPTGTRLSPVIVNPAPPPPAVRPSPPPPAVRVMPTPPVVAPATPKRLPPIAPPPPPPVTPVSPPPVTPPPIVVLSPPSVVAPPTNSQAVPPRTIEPPPRPVVSPPVTPPPPVVLQAPVSPPPIAPPPAPPPPVVQTTPAVVSPPVTSPPVSPPTAPSVVVSPLPPATSPPPATASSPELPPTPVSPPPTAPPPPSPPVSPPIVSPPPPAPPPPPVVRASPPPPVATARPRPAAPPPPPAARPATRTTRPASPLPATAPARATTRPAAPAAAPKQRTTTPATTRAPAAATARPTTRPAATPAARPPARPAPAPPPKAKAKASPPPPPRDPNKPDWIVPRKRS